MKRIVSSLVVLPLLVCAVWGAQKKAKEQTDIDPAQKFVVLHSNHFVAPTETLTNAEAHCEIYLSYGATLAGATGMSCRPAGVTAKATYHYNGALVVDSNGMGYAVACRQSLIAIWCKQYSAGTVLRAAMGAGKLTIDGEKGHDYVVLASMYLGLPPAGAAAPPRPAPAPAAAAPSQAATGPAPVPPASTANKASNNSEKASGDSFAACTPGAGACVSFVSDPLGADIYVDGKFVGNTPSMLTLAVGPHEIRMENANRKPWTRTLETSAGSKITVRATLEAIPIEK